MTELNLLNSKFESLEKFSTPITFEVKDINQAVTHQVVKALLANKRQGTGSSKTRAEVRGGGAKPFKQKGTGRARQGSSRAASRVGGGVCFGPRPRSFHQKVNKKVMLKAIHSVLADKYQAGKLYILDKLEISGKTKEMLQILEGKGINSGLFVTKNSDSNILKAIRNLRSCSGLPVCGFSVYQALKYENLLIEKEAMDVLLMRLK